MPNALKSLMMVSALCLLPLSAQAGHDGRHGQNDRGFFHSLKNVFTGDDDRATETRSLRSLSATDTRNLQQALANRGFYKGPIDGVWGSRTESAVRDYEVSAGQAPNGVLTTSDLRDLDVYVSDAGAFSDVSPAAGTYETRHTRSESTIRYTEKVDIVKYGNSGTARGRQAFLE